ncbi:MAG: WecB/TagA/CpsF family glycosyltransferase [Sedimentisphaerales bacterium]|nr:WecB/TagA/CpsF family glycosyltransferase [Sedimentisphaerales bacterium]
MKTYLAVYFGTVVTAIFLVPIVSRLAKRFHVVDVPGLRKIHRWPIPRIGGIAFVISTLVLIIPVFFLNNDISQAFRDEQTKYIAFLAGAVFLFIIGLIDDLHSLRGYIKLFCLVIASLAICASGATIESISFGSDFTLETGWAAWPLTVFWIIMITVGIVLIDGLDGLAAGIGAFACGTIFLMSLSTGQTAISVLMLAMLGSITGFLLFNFYPAKIFMGECGALFLGFMIGAASILYQAKTSALTGLAIPFLVMGLPILDTAYIIISRSIFERRSMFAPDRNHLHHRLLDLGLQHRTVVIVLYAVTAINTSIGVFILTTEGKWSIGLMMGGLLFLFSLFACLHSGRYRKMLLTLKHNRNLARQARKEMYNFENAQLRMRESKSFKTWWETICFMGEQMRFQKIGLWRYHDGEYTISSEWELIQNNSATGKMLRLALPLNIASGWELRAYICADTEDSLELSGRKVMLLSRLIDEFPLPEPEEGDGSQTYTSTIEESKNKRDLQLLAKVPEPVSIMDIPITPFESCNQVLDCVEEIIKMNLKALCVAINPLKIYKAWNKADLLSILRQTDICICDGIGVSIASRILHGRSIKRCTGCDLFFELVSLASCKGWGIFMLGASAESNAAARSNLQNIYPDLKIAGWQDGYFDNSESVIEKINSSQAKIIFVAMGSPKQEYWMWQHMKSMNVNFCMGVGGSFDVAAGNLNRAPKIFRKTGTEFLFRLAKEPQKRWKMQKDLFPYFIQIIGRKLVDFFMITDDSQNQTKR